MLLTLTLNILPSCLRLPQCLQCILTPYILTGQNVLVMIGYKFLGVQYSSTCWCGNYSFDETRRRPEDSCDMTCTGDRTQICGGSCTSSVYYVTPQGEWSLSFKLKALNEILFSHRNIPRWLLNTKLFNYSISYLLC